MNDDEHKLFRAYRFHCLVEGTPLDRSVIAMLRAQLDEYDSLLSAAILKPYIDKVVEQHRRLGYEGVRMLLPATMVATTGMTHMHAACVWLAYRKFDAAEIEKKITDLGEGL